MSTIFSGPSLPSYSIAFTLLVLVSCGPPPHAGPDSGINDDPKEASASPTQEAPAPPMPPDLNEGPMANWIVATDLTDLHATWTAFGSQSALGPGPSDALVPYADAVAHVGESWGLADGPPALVLIDSRGHAYRYESGRHGLDPTTETREAVDPAFLQSEGWQALTNGEDIHRAYQGSALQVLGALRSAGACGKCHQDQGSTLLGAYVYDLHEIADD